MFFFPYKVDLPLGRIPFFTILISVLCIIIYNKQISSIEKIETSLHEFCNQEKNDRDFLLSLTSIKNNELNSCETIIYYIHHSPDPDKTIEQLARVAKPIQGVSLGYSKQFITSNLQEKYRSINPHLNYNLTDKLAYNPSDYNVFNMLSSQFVHADIFHLLGNLLFFFAFAASIEVVLGALRFILLTVVLSLAVSIAYSLSTIGADISVPTIGLSGVVMGMIGIFSYLMPSASIRCLFIFIIYFRTFSIPAWLLAIWFIGWDSYELLTSSSQSDVNLVAHVSGALFGYILAAIFFRKKKQSIALHLKNNY